MRFIPTSTITVEKLKQLAKKTKIKLKIKHVDALDRVARGAGYDHWYHVTWCAADTSRINTMPPLLKECMAVAAAAANGHGILVTTGPEVLDRPLILFSTPDGDAWMLEPNEGRANCLSWHGAYFEPAISYVDTRIQIEWDGMFELEGDAFFVDVAVPSVGKRSIFGYPVGHIREAIHRIASFKGEANDIFSNRDTVPLSAELIDQLVAGGWKREDLESAAGQGAEYSPERGSLLFPMQFG